MLILTKGNYKSHFQSYEAHGGLAMDTKKINLRIKGLGVKWSFTPGEPAKIP
ncbi:MAG: hypothetical protein JSV88_03990 [Candidatus Aminicenantes bacterium]|nr:MAG: hypothetical protein JSV88_03990 [Candidatus Aminicenantes bacterium]